MSSQIANKQTMSTENLNKSYFAYFAFDTNVQYFAFSHNLIICSLHLHKFSYDSQIHNVLTCVRDDIHKKMNYFKWALPVWGGVHPCPVVLVLVLTK